ncbi:MAG: GHKL domain-containing protein, partial [Bacilli bacterium]|nr:GHKL domain-containing protein [Bacilli bacterium]
NKYDSLDKHYNDLYEYSKLSEEVNYDYRVKLHENKNQLLLIDSMINDKSKLKEYINYLLEQHKVDINNNYLCLIKSIPIPGIKNFINYKLVELKSIGAIIEVFVSDEIKDININYSDKDYNDISTTLGVILDNIIDSVKVQKKKLVSLNIYIEDEKLHFQCANSYDGKIDIDKIFKKGYSTKGNYRGVGLSLVKDIIDNNDIIDCKPLVIDNFFMQDIIIKIPKIIK